MELLLRILPPASPAEPIDVRVDIDPDQPAARLAAALAAYVDGRQHTPRLLLVRTGEVVDPEEAVGATGIVSGDEIALDPVDAIAIPAPNPIRAVSVDVLAGPDSGHSAVLDRGTYVIGRDPSCEIVVSDLTVSRRHLRVEVGLDWSVTIEPEDDPENGVFLNDAPLASEASVTGDDVVTLGSTRLAFREFIRAADEARDRLGQIEFHRTPYRPEQMRPREFAALGPIPTAPEPRRFQTLAALAPLAAGLAMFAFSGQAQFLVLTLLSPLALVANWFEDRRSGRSRYTMQVAKFRERLASRVSEVERALYDARVERVRAAPDLADLARRAELRTIDLWPRGRETEGFLVVRLGLGEDASLVAAPVEAQGDDELREEAEQALAGHDRLSGVPVTVDLKDAGVFAAHGDAQRVDDVAASILVQAACLQSPEDLIVTAAVSPDREFESWLKWLPHVRSTTSPLAGRHLASSPDEIRSLLTELIDVAERRAAESDTSHDRRWPWVLLVIDGDLEPEPTLVSQLLDTCHDGGVSVVWLSSAESRVPHQATAILDCQLTRGDDRAVLWSTDPDVDEREVELGRVHPDVADRVARCLAPVRDATVATATTAIPRTAPLFSVLGVDVPDERWIAERWLTNRPYGLVHPIGMGADGVFALDLVADGPHALIGGTSGAGKSELLQSMVASLISVYPPTRLNFLFVDYKGGASSTAFRGVPHTVGYVTNLDADLAMRALTSLRAELNRRMRLLEGRAKDLEEMLERHPDEAPPSLVIVVDEFATLVKEIPDFVAGMVDIAQRGRSLGIHLILATQRPSGSVNDNILANTNLRISLRMLDASESAAIIGSQEAAEIPVPLRGRAFARLGPRELVPFQSAYAGAPLNRAAGESPVVLGPFDGRNAAPTLLYGASAAAADERGGEDRTQLDVLIDAVTGAAAELQMGRGRAPWRDVLPDHLVLADVVGVSTGARDESAAARLVTVGLVDAPEDQEQYPAVVDLEDGGGLLVFGSGGAGKSTLLRTLAASASLEAQGDDVGIFVIDFASRALRTLEALPTVAAVATGDDLESVTRVIALLASEIERRRSALAAAQAETLTAYRARGRDEDDGGALARVLLLVDGYPNLASAFTTGGFGGSLDQWLEAFHAIVLEGRQVGIHTVLTADRRGGVPSILQSAIANRIVLRQADEAGYGDHGIPLARARSIDLQPGRGLWQAEHAVQIACVSATGDGPAQAAAIATLGAELRVRGATTGFRTAPLPDSVALTDVTAPVTPTQLVVGIADLTLQRVRIDIAHSHVLIAGLPQSGRSSALGVLADQLHRAGLDVWAVGPAGSPLRTSTAHLTRAAFGRADAILPALDELATLLDAFPLSDASRPKVLVVDDLDAMDDPMLSMAFERLARADGLRVIAAIETRNHTGFSMNALLNEVRKARRSLFLQPDDPVEFFQLTGVRPPIRPGTPMPPGRGVLVVDRRPLMVQVAKTVTFARPSLRIEAG